MADRIQCGDFAVLIFPNANGYHAEVQHHDSWVGSLFAYDRDLLLVEAGLKMAAHLADGQAHDLGRPCPAEEDLSVIPTPG